MRYLGQTITFLQQETTEIKNRIRAAWATFQQVQTGTDIEKLHAQTSSPAVRAAITPTIWLFVLAPPVPCLLDSFIVLLGIRGFN